MSLYKRGKVWWSRIEKDGKPIQRSTKCANKEDARKVEAKWRTDDALGEAGLSTKTQKMTLAQFEQKFFAYLPNRVSPSTIAFYKTAWIPIQFSSLWVARLDRIDSALIEQFVQRRRAQDVSPATV